MGLTHGSFSANLQTTIDSRAFMFCYINKLITSNFIVLHVNVYAVSVYALSESEAFSPEERRRVTPLRV